MQLQRQFFQKYIYILCILFGFSALVCHYYRPHTIFYNVLFDKSSGFKQALEQIPVCTSDDSDRQHALLYTLRAWTSFAEQHHIQYWIAYGTLAGYVHRHGLLPHDLDIDVAIMAQDTAHLFHLSQSNFSSIYKLVVHPQWYIAEETKRSYFPSEGIDFVGPNARFINLTDDVHIDIWPIYDYHPNQTKMEKNSQMMLTEYDKFYNWVSSPREWTFPLQECIFSGIKVWCPAEPNKMLTNIYGEISANTLSRACVNGSWVRLEEYKSPKQIMEVNNQSISIHQPVHGDTTRIKLNDFDLIEKALEDIPTCETKDRSRQRILLRTLQAWSRLAEHYNIQYWITSGTLVGYVQRHGLLPHDRDVDITMMSDDTPKVIQIAKSNFSSNYKIKVQPHWYIVGETNRSYFRHLDINFIAPNGRFVDIESDKHVDIFPAYDFNPLHSNISLEENYSDNLTVHGVKDYWFTYPRHWTYPLKTCYISRIKVLCPAEPEKLVEHMYGIEAVTRSDTKCEDSNWVDVDLKKSK